MLTLSPGALAAAAPSENPITWAVVIAGIQLAMFLFAVLHFKRQITENRRKDDEWEAEKFQQNVKLLLTNATFKEQISDLFGLFMASPSGVRAAEAVRALYLSKGDAQNDLWKVLEPRLRKELDAHNRDDQAHSLKLNSLHAYASTLNAEAKMFTQEQVTTHDKDPNAHAYTLRENYVSRETLNNGLESVRKDISIISASLEELKVNRMRDEEKHVEVIREIREELRDNELHRRDDMLKLMRIVVVAAQEPEKARRLALDAGAVDDFDDTRNRRPR